MSEAPPGPPGSLPPPDPASRVHGPPDPGGRARGSAPPAGYQPGWGAWGPGRAIGGIFVLIGLTAVEAVIVTSFDPGLKSLAAKLALQALLAITLVAVAFIGARPGRGTAAPGELGLRRPRRSPFGIAGLGYLAYIGFAAVYAPLVQPHQKDVTRVLGFGHGHFGAIAAGVLIVAAAPVSEEIFFRGFVFGGLRRRLPFVAAAAISAAIFGIFHYTGPSSLGVVPQLAFLGLVLAFVYERTGSIWPTMAIHIANNALAFAILTS